MVRIWKGHLSLNYCPTVSKKQPTLATISFTSCSLGQRVVDTLKKLSKIGFSMKCLKTDFLRVRIEDLFLHIILGKRL